MLIHFSEPAGPSRPSARSGNSDDDAERERAEIAPERDPGGRRRRRALALARRLRQRSAHAAGGDRADAVEPDAPVGARHLAQENEDEDDRRDPERQRPAADQHKLVVDVRFGAVADDREAKAEGDERRGGGGAQRRNELPGAGDVFGERRACVCEGAVMLKPSRLRAGRECRRA